MSSRARWLPLVVLIAIPSSAHGESRMSFDDAVTLADGNPRWVGAQRARRTLEVARDRSPGLDVNPVVTVTAGPRVTPGVEAGLEGSVGISQSISLEGSATLRRDALGAEAAWLGADADGDRLSRRLGAAAAWLALWEAERQLELATNDATNEEELVRLVTRLVDAGERTRADLAVFEARLADARLRERMAEGAVVEARGRLASETRSSRGEVIVTVGPMPEARAPSKVEAERLLSLVPSLPAIQAKGLLARAELVRGAEERAARGARITVGGEARRDALGATVVQGVLSVPLPLFAVGGREQAARSASALRLEGEVVDDQRRARAMVEVALHEVEHTDEVWTLIRTTLLPAAERAAAMREKQLRAGEGTVLDVIDARRGVLDARARLVRAFRERAWARVQINLLATATAGGEP
jgi:outer membrane protein TolC